MEDLNPNHLEPQKRSRRTHSKAFKSRLVAMAEAGDASVAQIAMDHRINANQLRKWMKESHTAPESVNMLPVSVAGDSCSPLGAHTGTIVMELNVSGSSIRFYNAWDPQAVATLIKALQ